MPTATKQRRGAEEMARAKNRSNVAEAGEFAAGSLETTLSAIGKSVPTRDWAKVPADYFANLDHYVSGAPKKEASAPKRK
jgi:hypothetical protein